VPGASSTFSALAAVCSSFVEGRKHALEELAPGTLYLPHATIRLQGSNGCSIDTVQTLPNGSPNPDTAMRAAPVCLL